MGLRDEPERVITRRLRRGQHLVVHVLVPCRGAVRRYDTLHHGWNVAETG